jgi:hypothetical protein
MNKWLLPAGALTAVVVGIFVVLAVAGAFDGDDGGGRVAAESDEEADAARCAVNEAGDDCAEDAGGDAFGICIAEDDPNYDPEQPCEDTPAGDGSGSDGSLNTCIEGTTDCVDTPLNPDEPVSGGGGDSMNMCIEGVVTCNDTIEPDGDPDAIGGGEEGKAVAVEAALAALTEIGGPSDAKVASAHAVEWGNACLGVDQPDVACAEVITPGWIIVLEAGDLAYEFHTDLNGNAVLAAPAE